MDKQNTQVVDAKRVARPVQSGGEVQQVQALTRLSDISLEKMTPESALALCKAHPDKMAQMLMALLARDTVALPGTAFIKREDVFLKKFRVGVRLTASEGHLLSIGHGERQKWDFTISALRKLNEIPALNLIRPNEVTVDGQRRMNPYIQVDPKSKMPEVVYARCFAVGYSPMGSLVASDTTIRLDLNIYLLETVQAKMKYLGKAVPKNAERLGVYSTSTRPPMDEDGKPRAGNWQFMPIHSVGDMGLWINMADENFSEIFLAHTTKLKFIERLAQSFAERNCLKAHPAIPKSVQVTNGVALVPMTGWTTDFSRDDIDNLKQLIEHDKLQEFRDKAGQTIAVETVEETTLDEAAMASLDEEATGEKAFERNVAGEKDDAADKAEEPVRHAPGPDQLLAQAATLYGRLTGVVGTPEARKIMNGCGIAMLEEATPEEMSHFIATAEDVLNAPADREGPDGQPPDGAFRLHQ